MSKLLLPRGVAILLVLLAFTGCFETKQDITLNPDGSGKIVIESTFARNSAMLGGVLGGMSRSSLEEQMQAAVKEVILKSNGVDAWRDVTYRRLPDGRIHFKGTAYFPSLSKLKITDITFLNFSLEKGPDGTMALNAIGTDEEETAKRTPPAKITAQEMTDWVARARAEYQEGRAMMIGVSATIREETTVHLPAAAVSASNFQKPDEKTLTISFVGSKAMAAVDTLAGSEEWWRARLRAGSTLSTEGFDLDDLELNARVFGEAAPVRATFKPGAQAQFDYQKEVAAAKQEFPALVTRLGIKPEEIEEAASNAKGKPEKKVAPTAQVEMRGVRLTGLKAVFEEGGLYMSTEPSITLGVQGFLGEDAVEGAGGEIITAVGSDGVSLRMPKTALDKDHITVQERKVTFELELNLPAANVKELKEVSGVIDYYVDGPTKKTDFGIGALKAGAKGSEHEARIKSLDAPANGQPGKLELEVQLPSWRIKEVRLLDQDGEEIEMDNEGSSSSNDKSTLSYTFKQALPPKTQLEVEILDPPIRHQGTFKLEHIALPPHPPE